MKRGLIALLGLLSMLAACSASETRLPYPAWRIGFGAPARMDVWVEDARVLDVAGKRLGGYGVGIASVSPTGNPAGWPKVRGAGAGMDVIGAALPKAIYVRWQSLVEPQAYQVVLHFTDAMRKQMLTEGPPVPQLTHVAPRERYYKNVVIVLAPGGWVKVWLGGVVEKAIPVMCVKARVVPQGPDLGKYGGRYVKLSAKTKAYIAQHSIPYASWKCAAN